MKSSRKVPAKRPGAGPKSRAASADTGPAKLTAAVARRLVEAARQVRKRAYAPYSGFHVGAALLGASGKVHVGFNVENISYGLCVCAERTALFSALIAGEENFVAIAVATDSPDPVMPCGACRQVLREFSADMPVLVAPRTGAVVRRTLDKLIPEAFFSFPGSGRKGGR